MNLDHIPGAIHERKMLIRWEFIRSAMQGLCAASPNVHGLNLLNLAHQKQLAQIAVRIADQTLVEAAEVIQ